MYLPINQSIPDYWFQSLIIWLLILSIFTESSYAFNCAYYLNKMLTFVSFETYLKSVRNSDIIVINTLTIPKTVKPVINCLQPYVHWLQIKYSAIRQELNIYSSIFIFYLFNDIYTFLSVIKVPNFGSLYLKSIYEAPIKAVFGFICISRFGPIWMNENRLESFP